jgi:Fibronectin type III domain
MSTQCIAFLRGCLHRGARRHAGRALGGVLAVAVLLTAGLAIPVAEASPSSGCPHDRPCIGDVYETTAGGLFFRWSDTDTYDFYQVRWRHDGGPDHQVKLRGGRGGSFHIKNVWPGTRYIFSVQGCDSNFLSSSDCTKWEGAYYDTE